MSHLLTLVRCIMLLVAVDSLLCISLWLAGGDSLYLEDSVKEFSFTHSTFDLVVIAAVRGVLLFGCFYYLETISIQYLSVKDRQASFAARFAILCEVVILLLSGTSLIYAVVKGGMIIHSVVKGTWNDVTKEIEMHITYKILCVTAAVFPVLEVVLGLISLWFVRTMVRVQKLRLIVNHEGDEEEEPKPAPQKKASIKRIIVIAKPVSEWVSLLRVQKPESDLHVELTCSR